MCERKLLYASRILIRFPDNDISIVQGDVAPFTPSITAAASDFENTDIYKVVKNRIDDFFDGMPVFMKALDEVKNIHPFIDSMSPL